MPVQALLELALLALVTLAAIVDLARRRIPNLLLLTGWMVAVPLHLLSDQPGPAVLGALAGALCGLLIFLPLYLLRGMAAGDVKMMATVGLFVGPLDDALQVAEQLRAAVTAVLLPTGAAPCAVTVSIGVAALHADETLAAGLARADQALYDAKRSGRNQVSSASVQCVEIEPARAGQAGVAVTGQESAILRTGHSRQQFCA